MQQYSGQNDPTYHSQQQSFQQPSQYQQPPYPGQPPQYQQPQYPGQRPQYQQPPYPGQPPYQPPVMPQPQKKRGCSTPLIIAAAVIVVALLTCGGIVAATSMTRTAGTTTGVNSPPSSQTQAPQATQASNQTAPTSAPQTWKTTHTFSGNGIKKTGIFTAPDDWKILWKCKPSSFYGGSYNLIVTVYNADGTPADIAINVICKAGTTSGDTEEHTGGSVYLDTNSEGSWTIQVQELK